MSLERIQDIIVDVFRADFPKPTARLREDLDASSLDIAELVSALKKEFGIEINDTEWQHVTDVASLAALVKKKTG